MAVRVMVIGRAREGHEEDLERAFGEVTSAVQGTPGLLRDEMLKSEADPLDYIILSEWESRDAFLAWEKAPVHMQSTTPMRDFWEPGSHRRVLFEVKVDRSAAVGPLPDAS